MKEVNELLMANPIRSQAINFNSLMDGSFINPNNSSMDPLTSGAALILITVIVWWLFTRGG
jgi:hypothetical protein